MGAVQSDGHFTGSELGEGCNAHSQLNHSLCSCDALLKVHNHFYDCYLLVMRHYASPSEGFTDVANLTIDDPALARGSD